ncbi:lipocalin-like domain-containing protein [Pseudoalteromonas sp. A757]|uniref:lipocalin-like domain-containing protein n=1 Tax=Pseudoalteromonas sp. A757 TaxID=2250709 RepID=UPI000FFF49EE|nr:lipocalin-like domain-containing protein [Pseudoalteromonas sp. A757]RXE86003.1 ABC transporter [Pseudoalteromonas sp. A757]
MKINPVIALLLLFLVAGCTPELSQVPASKNDFFNLELGEPVSPSYQLSFPFDHGSHPEQGIEWWYVTANLKSDSGQEFGVQWTLFRTSVANVQYVSPWWDNELYFAHFAIQDNTSHQAFERYGRAGQVKIQANPFVTQLDNWYLRSETETFFPLTLHAEQEKNRANLTLDTSPMVLHGKNGYSEKTSDGHASMYYSYPFLTVKGELTFQGETHRVSGDAWLDREWSSSFISKAQRGWDWFSIRGQNRSNGALMVFCIRDNQQFYKDCRGTEISVEGRASEIGHKDIQLSVLEQVSLDGVSYPFKWQLRLKHKSPILIESINRDARNQLTIPYWEGRVKVSGGYIGEGYAELVGYE